ncbi:hypothetical protein JCM3774_000196 [Rhodotorula dairenensis]
MTRATSTARAAAAAGGRRRRTFPAAKALAFREQAHLVSNNDLVLFLRPGDFAAHEWRSLRQQIAAVPPPPPTPAPTASTSATGAAAPAPPPTAAAGNQLRLTYLRPGLIPAIVRTLEEEQQRAGGGDAAARKAAVDTSLLSNASHSSSGPLAALTAPTLHPPTLLHVLNLLQIFSRTPPADAPPAAATGPDATPLERLKLVSSLLNRSTAADPDRTFRVANLPPLEVLHAQIVGLLSAPGARITGVVSARASELARTLQGFKVGLEQASAPAPESTSST